MKGARFCKVHVVAWVLVIIGAINWGLVGLFDWNLLVALFGTWPMVVRVLEVVVGLSGLLMLLVPSCKPCRECMK
ncbi:MAG: DUF378 domain-containing protein [bacterium]